MRRKAYGIIAMGFPFRDVFKLAGGLSVSRRLVSNHCPLCDYRPLSGPGGAERGTAQGA